MARRSERKELLREIDRSHKTKARAKVADLRGELRDARATQEKALEGASSRCRTRKRIVSKDVKEMRADAFASLRAELRQDGEAMRAKAREACSLDKNEVEEETRPAIENAREALAEEKNFQGSLQRIEQGNRKRSRERKRSTAAERRSESDDEVRSNIALELVPLFEKVKRSIKGGPRETRTEAFLRYAEEHPDEHFESIEDRTEQMIREHERQLEEQASRRRRNPVSNGKARGARGLWAADPHIPSVELGELVAVVYRVLDGGTYEHRFRGPRPVLAYNTGGLLVAGGKYRVGPGGIT